MTLDVLKQREYGDPALMESAFKALMCKLSKHDYFASGDEADSYKGYHGDPAHWCSFMRREIMLGRKPIAIDFTYESELRQILSCAVCESGTSMDNFVDYCTQRGLWFFFNLWGLRGYSYKECILIIGAECEIYPSSTRIEELSSPGKESITIGGHGTNE